MTWEGGKRDLAACVLCCEGDSNVVWDPFLPPILLTIMRLYMSLQREGKL